MKRKHARAAALAAVLACGAPAQAQVSALEFHASRVPVGKVFHLAKSNFDGSHSAQISYYVASPARIEALKWDQGGDQATLVIADMDWQRFSVRAFESWHLSREAAPEMRATLTVDPDNVLTMSLMKESITLRHFPWHSFDFDFTSLTLAMPHLRNPKGTLKFWRTDFVYSDPPSVAELGEVTLRFSAYEQHAGLRTRRYTIGGPGLQDQNGTWWADARTGLLVEFELPIGDEPGYDSVRVKLTHSQAMSADQWQEFKRRAVAGP